MYWVGMEREAEERGRVHEGMCRGIWGGKEEVKG